MGDRHDALLPLLRAQEHEEEQHVCELEGGGRRGGLVAGACSYACWACWLASQHGWRPELLPPPTAAGSAAVTPRSASPASPATPRSPQIVAAACLFLAGKINDKPRHHSKVANLLLARWYGKDNPQLQRLAAGAPTQDAAAVRHLPPAQVAEARAFWENM